MILSRFPVGRVLSISPGVRCAPILLGTPGEIATRVPCVPSHFRHDKDLFRVDENDSKPPGLGWLFPLAARSGGGPHDDQAPPIFESPPVRTK